jgi:hypothetical protein
MFDAYSGHDILAAYDKIGGSERPSTVRDQLPIVSPFSGGLGTVSRHTRLVSSRLSRRWN